MNEQPPRQPAWEDIHLTEIEALIADNRVDAAIILAGLRLDGIKNIPEELRLARASSGDIPHTQWTTGIQAFELEITQLMQIIANYTK